jgi:hypothetical protein
VPEEAEYAPQYSREQRIKHALLGFGIACAVIFTCNVVLFPKLLMMVHGNECQTVFGVSGVAVVMCLVFVGLPLAIAASLGAFVIPRALAAIRARQYPAPGRKVSGKVRIRRGGSAVLNGWADIGGIGLLVAIAIWGSFQATAISRQAARTPMDCVRVPEHPRHGDAGEGS